VDCNVYLLDCGSEFVMIDAGGGVDPERIVRNIEKDGISMDQVTHLLLTHVHGDHAAGASYFKERYGLKVAVSEEAVPWLEQGDRDKTSLNHAIRGGVYPPDFDYPPCPAHIELKDNSSLAFGAFELSILSSPGHSRGHMSFYWEENGVISLFSGDAVFAGGKVVIQYVWDCIIDEYARTIEKLHLLGIDALYPGHGPFLCANARNHIKMAHQHFSRLEVPPNL
jgi:hydroxyacylglutathione hydrolase